MFDLVVIVTVLAFFIALSAGLLFGQVGALAAAPFIGLTLLALCLVY